MSHNIDEAVFRTRVTNALNRVRTILDNTRTPQYAADVSHEYSDKYLLSEFLTDSAISAYINALEAVGLSAKIHTQLQAWAKTHNVTMRMRAEEYCKFLRKTTREIESDKKHVIEKKNSTRKEYTVTKVNEWFWSFEVKWELIAFAGSDASKAVVLQGRSGTIELKTSVETAPKPEAVVKPPLDMNITWLLHSIDSDTGKPSFAIDRKNKHCHTPRRNSEIDEARVFTSALHSWATSVASYFTNVFKVQSDHGLDTSSLRADTIFVPVLPLFEKQQDITPYLLEEKTHTTSSSDKAPSVLPAIYSSVFLEEQLRSISETTKDLGKAFPSNDKLVTLAEAKLVVLLLHTQKIGEAYWEGVDYIEQMLHKQLIAAIGKEVTPADLTNYFAFHSRKLFKAGYQPRPFCYAIRRPNHYPEGTVTIETQLAGNTVANPISTIASHSTAGNNMYFSINESTQIGFGGDRYVHGWVSHQFSGDSNSNFSLVARARQFSSFILLVGRIVSAELFEPKHAIIIQNKDDLKIPLMLETIPTPKEFRDAIESLSPEQQQFAKAFRSMQLESTLFGVCIVQIKPQLEKLLLLPDDSLTKEIKLTQDLLSLFIKYQIPSDLISYDGEFTESATAKVTTVKGYVANMQAMIKQSKQSDLEDAQTAKQYHQYGIHEGEEDEMADDREFLGQECYAAPGQKKGLVAAARSTGSRKRGLLSYAQQESVHQESCLVQEPPAQQPTQAPAKKAKKIEDDAHRHRDQDSEMEVEGALDYTKLPSELERKYEEFDTDSALHPTIIKTDSVWSKKFNKSVLAEQETTSLLPQEQEQERNKAFDLLDALTKSGSISIDHASLHVVIAATHCFDKTIMQTVIQDNINPIEKIENSLLIVGSTIHHTPPAELVAPAHLPRVSTNLPLFLEHKTTKVLSSGKNNKNNNNNNNNINNSNNNK